MQYIAIPIYFVPPLHVSPRGAGWPASGVRGTGAGRAVLCGTGSGAGLVSASVFSLGRGSDLCRLEGKGVAKYTLVRSLAIVHTGINGAGG